MMVAIQIRLTVVVVDSATTTFYGFMAAGITEKSSERGDFFGSDG